MVRFYMLETIREFAEESFLDSSLRPTLEKHHASYYLALAQEAHPHLTGEEHEHWSSKLEQEQDNFRKALNWCFREQDHKTAYEFGIALWRFWNNRSLLAEGLEQVQKILTLSVSGEDLRLRLKMLEGLGVLYQNLQMYLKAYQVFKETLELWPNLGYPRELAVNLNHFGWASLSTGDLEEGERASREALALHESHQNALGQAVSYNNLAWIEHERGVTEAAISLWRKSASLRLEAADQRGYGFALSNVAIALNDAGRYEDAKQIINEAISIHKTVKATLNLFWDYILLANIHLDQGDVAPCQSLLEEIYYKGFAIIGSLNFKVYYNMFQARMHMYKEEYMEAEKVAREGYEIANRHGISGSKRRIMVTLAQNACRAGWLDKCRAWCTEGLNECIACGDRLRCAQFLECRGAIYWQENRAEKATQLLAFADTLRTKIEAPVPPVEISYQTSMLEALRAHCGTERFQKSWTIGRALSVEEVIEAG